jgi:hypothetical protein
MHEIGVTFSAIFAYCFIPDILAASSEGYRLAVIWKPGSMSLPSLEMHVLNRQTKSLTRVIPH